MNYSKTKSYAHMLVLVFLASQATGQDVATYNGALLTVVNDTIVASEAPGIVLEIKSNAGSDVAADSVLVALNREVFEAELRVAQAELMIAEIEAANDVNIRFSDKTHEVNRKLLARSQNARQAYAKSVTRTDIDRLQLELDQSKLSTRQAELKMEVAKKTVELRDEMVDVARIKLEDRDIKSPFDGRIEQMFVHKGQWINAGDPIARVLDLTKLQIKAIFNEEFILKIKPGNEASFRYSIGEKKFNAAAKVTYVSSVIKNNVFQVWVDVDNSQLQLIPGVQGKLEVKLVTLSPRL